MKKQLLFLLSLCVLSIQTSAENRVDDLLTVTVEEARIVQAQQAMPDVFKPLANRVAEFTRSINKAVDYASLLPVVLKQSNLLWQDAVASFQTLNNQDDRSLYWARLQVSKFLRTSKLFKSLTNTQQKDLMWQFELVSRGRDDVNFGASVDKKILMTGFDPFFLDRHIDQSNPSGANSLALDNTVLNINGKSVQIETLIVPVRFVDFDQGMIETLLTPYFKDRSVDMVITVSMGRSDFDLERFPGLRRSAEAPGNLNVLTGASSTQPLVPLLGEKPLNGPEFVQFSLPVNAMQKAAGEYVINDNHFVETLAKGKWYPKALAELESETAVQGSGGGYLSNEISYRSILLRNQYAKAMPVGHIHTPRIKAFEPEVIEAIIVQIKNMIRQSVSVI